MKTLVVLTQVESAVPLVRWAGRSAHIRNPPLTVLFCLFGEPSLSWEIVTAEHPSGSEELLQVAAEAMYHLLPKMIIEMEVQQGSVHIQ